MRILYRVDTLAKVFKCHYGCFKDVKIIWIVVDRETPPVTYEQGIAGYKPDTQNIYYAKKALEELLTFYEAVKLKEFLHAKFKNCETKIREITLPLEVSAAGYNALPSGGGFGKYELFDENEYILPFKVVGYYDIRNSEYSRHVFSNGDRLLHVISEL